MKADITPPERTIGLKVDRLRPDPRLPAYLAGGLGVIVFAIASGNASLVALGAPLLVLAALGLYPRPPGDPRARLELEDVRALESDVIPGEIEIDWQGVAEVDVIVTDLRGLEPVDPAPVLGWSLPAGTGPVRLPFRLRAHMWGAHESGALWVRVRRPGGLVLREKKVASLPPIRVLPTALRLSRLLEPTESRAMTGMHVTRTRGHGSDFAELRPYRPGDRLRDISWGTSARLDEPWVRVNHPERIGTILLLLDVVFTEGTRSREGIARVARAAWTVASAHLQAQDRVGLLARGRTVAWLPPRGGRRARWMLLDELLNIGQVVGDASRRRTRSGRVFVPPDALVVGVSTLRAETFVPQLVHLRRQGHATGALVLDTSDLLPEEETRADTAARRIWLAQQRAQERELERAGVPTARVAGGESAGPAILALRRKMKIHRRSVRSLTTAASEPAGTSESAG